jgi:hypothetical protein
MWPGSEVKWDQGAPMEVDKFNGSESLVAKHDRVISWLDIGSLDKRPELILTYVPLVDTVGHKYGISGDELKDALAMVDDLVGSIIDGINARNLGDIVNLVILSDHGMAPTSNDRLLFTEDLVDVTMVEHMDGWPLVALRFNDGVDVHQAYQDIKAKEPSTGEWKVYLKEELPREWNFGGKTKSQYDSRMAPVWLVPSVGWAFTSRDLLSKMPDGQFAPKGIHGYNSSESLMRAIFLAQGPYFDSSTMYSPIPNVDVYNILCDTLGLVPSANDGAPAPRTLITLPLSWRDPQPYPGVSFHTEILNLNSTYDDLFANRPEETFDVPSQTENEPQSAATPTASSAASSSTDTGKNIGHKIYDWVAGMGSAAASAASDAWSSTVDWFGSLFGGAKGKDGKKE